MLTSDEIVTELNRLDVSFFHRDGSERTATPVEPACLLASMASSDEARVRLAIIPLLFRHPEIAVHVIDAAKALDGIALVFLRCYYTAALILRQKSRVRIQELGLSEAPLEDWFSEELGIPVDGDLDERLACVARRQAELSGDDINWLGTYSHGSSKFLRFYDISP